MKIRNLMAVGLMVAGFGTVAQAQPYYGAPPIVRRVEADRRVIAHERMELRCAPNGYVAAHEYRELRAAERRLAWDRQAMQNRYPGRW